jgi:site-specific recombinase XerD
MTSYTARYSYTNILVQNNVPVPLIQQALGHASIETTHIRVGYGSIPANRYQYLVEIEKLFIAFADAVTPLLAIP